MDSAWLGLSSNAQQSINYVYNTSENLYMALKSFY